MIEKQTATFLRFAKITLLLTYSVIIAGAVVRATGSGMGCPDWPKCFGQYIPPTSVEQLPEKYLKMHLSGEMTFNVFQTYTEYINRLMGALLGISVFVLLLLSIKFLKTNRAVFWLTLFSFLLIGFQGWLGAKVVSSNLAAAKITTHMVVALLILALFIYIIQFVKRANENTHPFLQKLKPLLWLTVILTVAQTLMGTQVREQVDEIAKRIDNRDLWSGEFGLWFYVHRSFSILVLALNALVFYRIKKSELNNTAICNASFVVMCFIATEILTGITLNYFAVPAYLQPVHLLLASCIFGYQSKMVFLR
jgi:cytochrome c oxidase assembly protein subunit 15